MTNIAVVPVDGLHNLEGQYELFTSAVERAGGTLTSPKDAEGLIWATANDPDGLRAILHVNPSIRWVQLPYAGIEPYLSVVNNERLYTCGKGVYAEPVAEHALGLALAGMRGIGMYARASSWAKPYGYNLLGARVVIFGGGEITRSLLRLLEPFGTHVTVVRNRVAPLEGAADVVGAEAGLEVIKTADLVVLALALTPQTRGLVDATFLNALQPHAWLVNVARGAHIVTDDLVAALTAGTIGGAALDVTDPEPLPDGHPLWTTPNTLITPHVANTPQMGIQLLAKRIEANVRRFIAGEALLGPVDPELGY